MLLILDILTDNREERDEDNVVFGSLGGYAGIMVRSLGAGCRGEYEVRYLDAGLCSLGELVELQNDMRHGSVECMVLGGSVMNVSAKDVVTPRIQLIFDAIVCAHGLQIPTIGFCGGHQFGARALAKNPQAVRLNSRRHFSTSAVAIQSDVCGSGYPLFAGCSLTPMAQWSHRYIVDALPSEQAVLLASHQLSSHAAFQDGSFIGLQWHPEVATEAEFGFGVEFMRTLAKLRKDALLAEGFWLGKVEADWYIENMIQPAPESARLIENWFSMIRSGFFKR